FSFSSHLYRPPPTLSTFLSPDTPPPEISSLSLHDALPIFERFHLVDLRLDALLRLLQQALADVDLARSSSGCSRAGRSWRRARRSEEHTSELQSLTNLVCRLLLEKKKNNKRNIFALMRVLT